MKLSNKIYDIAKWVSIIVLPALATFYGTLAPAWGLPYKDAIVVTINAVAVLIGAVIGVSTINYNKEEYEETDDPEQ